MPSRRWERAGNFCTDWSRHPQCQKTPRPLFIRLSRDARSDVERWYQFSERWNGIAMMHMAKEVQEYVSLTSHTSDVSQLILLHCPIMASLSFHASSDPMWRLPLQRGPAPLLWYGTLLLAPPTAAWTTGSLRMLPHLIEEIQVRLMYHLRICMCVLASWWL